MNVFQCTILSLQVFETSVDSPVNCCCYVNDFLVACGTQNSAVHCVDLRVPRFVHIWNFITMYQSQTTFYATTNLPFSCFSICSHGSVVKLMSFQPGDPHSVPADIYLASGWAVVLYNEAKSQNRTV